MLSQPAMQALGLVEPMNVQQIVAKAEAFEYNSLTPFRYWLRTAGTLLKEAEIYEHEGNDQQTYLLLYRHARLVVKYLSNESEAKDSQYRTILSNAQRDVDRNIKKLEVLKPRINTRYERYQQLIKEREARTRKSQSTSPREFGAQQPGQIDITSPIMDPALSNTMRPLTAEDHKDFAVQLAQTEMHRRATARKATRQTGISEQEEHRRRTAGVWSNWENALVDDGGNGGMDRASKQMLRLKIADKDNSRTTNSTPSTYRYPSIAVSPGTEANLSTPIDHYSPSSQAPRPPPKISDSLPQGDQQSMHNQKTKASVNGKALYPADFAFKPSAYLENGSPLRTVFLPSKLRSRFLDIAAKNTRTNLETCGILCGALVSNALFISTLVIPEQESTSDTCEMVNESDLFDYVDGEDLLVLGWIHTHPTQTCFMSSRDLHTHGGYQVMLPESIAIVCAPSKGDWGAFRLTDPPGLKTILSCTKTGLFHPHAEARTYTDALRPGHVCEAAELDFHVVDLRKREHP